MMAPERPGPEDEPGVALRGINLSDIPIYSLHNGLLRELKEGDGANNVLAAIQVNEAERPAGEDNDLTSLSWLQDKNLLKGMNLTAGTTEAQESPTSDFVDDTGSELADSTCSSGPSPPSPPPHPHPTPSKHKHPQHTPYDPHVHITSKPPYSFSCLIFMAIEDSTQRALPVKEIYAWILDHFPYFKNAPTGWKNSVRHNLSLNKCFRKVEKAPNLGKGSLWMVDPMYRPNLLQALQKAPFHPYTTLDRINMVSSRHQDNNNTPIAKSELIAIKSNGRLPNPDLFPFLSRRLAASGVEDIRSRESDSTTDEENSLDDVDAAAAMLALKHGPRLLAPKKEAWLAMRDTARSNRKKLRVVPRIPAVKTEPDTKPDLVITTSPSEDHTYSVYNPPPSSTTVSPDEAYGEGSDSDDSTSHPARFYTEIPSRPMEGVVTMNHYSATSLSDSEEQRKIAEGADALLNLAGIPTHKRYYSGDFPSPSTPSTPLKRPRKDFSPPPPTPTKSKSLAFRPRILRSPARPKKEAKSRQRGNSRKRKIVNNNNNNNLIVNGNGKYKNVKTNERDWTHQSKYVEKIGKHKR